MITLENEVWIRRILNVFAVMFFVAALDSIFSDRIWLFLLYLGVLILLVFSPSDLDFYSSKFSSLAELAEQKVVIDVYSFWAHKIGLLLSSVGVIGQFYFGG